MVGFGFIEKMLLAVAVGGVIGLEREHTKKQIVVGLRTFSLVSLLGMVLTELSKSYSLIIAALGLLGIFALTIFFYYFKATHLRRALGLTTVLMIPLTYIFGALIGLGLILEAVSAAIVAAYLLVERREVHELVNKLSRREIIDGLVFAIIAFVVYPLVPGAPIMVLGQPLSLQNFVVTVILVSLISFISHMVLRFVHKNAVLYSSFLGGLISSLATLTLFSGNKKLGFKELRVTFASSRAGGIFRAVLLLAVLSLPLFYKYAALFAIPLVAFGWLASVYSKHPSMRKLRLAYNEPISLWTVLKFASVLFAVTFLLTFVSAATSGPLLYISIFFGGAISSASAVSAIVSLQQTGSFSQNFALNALFLSLLGSLASAFVVISKHLSWKLEREAILLFLASTGFVVLGFLASLFFPLT